MDDQDIRKFLIPHRLRKITEWNPIVNDGLQAYVRGTYTLKTVMEEIVVHLAQRVRQLEQDLFAAYVIGNHKKEDKNNA